MVDTPKTDNAPAAHSYLSTGDRQMTDEEIGIDDRRHERTMEDFKEVAPFIPEQGIVESVSGNRRLEGRLANTAQKVVG